MLLAEEKMEENLNIHIFVFAVFISVYNINC